MWKKSDEPTAPPRPASTPSPPTSSPRAAKAIATLGPSIVINGDLTGEEDLVIEGRVHGEVRLTKNSVTVGKQGQIRADIRGLRIHVEGEVRGNLYGEEEVVIRASGRVQGNIVAPRVTLENGSKFKGAIDMEPATARSTTPAAEPKKAASSTSAPSGPSGPSKASTSPASASSSKPS